MPDVLEHIWQNLGGSTAPRRIRNRFINQPKQHKSMIFFKLCYFLNGINANPTSGSPPAFRKKLHHHIRITAFIILATFFFTANQASAQTVTLNVKDTTLENVFNEIKKQTGYGFWYEKKDISISTKITVNIKNAPIREAIEKCLTGLPYAYEIFDKTIVIKKKAAKTNTEIKSGRTIDGSVVDENGTSMQGVNVKSIADGGSTVTDRDGFFSIPVSGENPELQFSFMGYETQSFAAVYGSRPKVILKTASNLLKEVSINTGFDNVPKERATGSFVQIDNELLNRNGVSTNILQRLEGVTSGMNFNNRSFDGNGARQARQSDIEVRGRATLFSPAEPLIILDNFPYDGDLANINPNDIESITILKDAAAASLWGARSGNGVIVLTSKKGKLNSAPKISFNSSFNFVAKPDLYSQQQLSSGQFIEVQKFLFDRGAYNTIINNGYSALPPAVDILLAGRAGAITQDEQNAQLEMLGGFDVREQMLKYNYRNAVQQQYQANLSGGTSSQKYLISAGYNSNLNGTINSKYDRITLNANNTYYLLKNRMEFASSIIYTSSKSETGPSLTALFPYSQFADAAGNALVQARDLRVSYASSAGNGKLLDWQFRPLDEVRRRYGTSKIALTSYRINLSLNYAVFKGLKLSALYGYEKGLTESNTLNELQSYYTRNLINRLTQINPTSGAVTYPLPLGGILDNSLANLSSHNGRFQASYSGNWGQHAVSALAGSEIKDQHNLRNAMSYYGYNPETELSQNGAISYITDYPLFYNPSSTSRINPNISRLGSDNRFLSYYFNGSYVYSGKYILTLSARRDESNLFGVATNQKGVPLWSAGVAWDVSKEKFLKSEWFKELKLRATYGYTGTVNNSISAYLTANNFVLNDYGTNYAAILNPPNPDLRWERVANLNLGLDFSVLNRRISGSIDLWRKKGIDLIGNSPIAPQTGISIYTGNSANTSTKGIDVQLNTINIDKRFKWKTTLLYNMAKSKVTDYKVSNGTNLNVVSANYNNPLEGYPFYALFSFRYAGLNQTGAPQGYLNGAISENYSSIMTSTDRSQLTYHGSAVPTSFGSILNNFEFKQISLSLNIAYKFGHYFRRPSLNNSSLYSTSGSYQMPDYDQRWQIPGDEQKTSVPAMIYPANVNRTNLYSYSDALVESADHIRLQDIRLGYSISPNSVRLIKRVDVFAYLSNLGIIWKANKKGIDPDSPMGIRNPRNIAIGLRADL